METIIYSHLKGQQPHYQRNIIMLLYKYVLCIFQMNFYPLSMYAFFICISG